MVKIKGPLMSQNASGSIGQNLTFATWKGRSYARKRGLPGDPKSPTQVSYRAVMGFLAEQWATIDTADQATWTLLALELNLPPYNAFVKHNLDRWTQFKRPSKVFPATETGDRGDTTNESATGYVGYAKVRPRIRDQGDIWGFTIHRSTAPIFTESLANCIALLVTPTETTYNYFDRGLEPGTYYYRVRAFTTDGRTGSTESERAAIVT